MSWTAPKIQAMLLRVAPARAAADLRPGKAVAAHSPSPRAFAAGSKSGYGRK